MEARVASATCAEVEEGRMTDEVTVLAALVVGQDGSLSAENPAVFRRSLQRARMLGKVVFAELHREKRTRTLPQNARWYGLLVPLFSDYTGYHKEEAHEELLRMFGPVKVATWADGSTHEIPKRSSEWTVEEARDTQDRVERFFVADPSERVVVNGSEYVSGCGIRIPADERRGVA